MYNTYFDTQNTRYCELNFFCLNGEKTKALLLLIPFACWSIYDGNYSNRNICN
jgi:hypothetical protein